MINLKSFEKSDWGCFAGASGSDPKIDWDVEINVDTFSPEYRGIENWCLIVDEEGISLEGHNGEGESEAMFVFTVDSQYLAELIVKGLQYPFNYEELIKAGFEDIM